MIADVEALQYLYGANFSTNNTDTIYTWDRDTGQEFINGIPQDHTEEHGIYMTLWDGGGTDTFDFSNFRSDVSVDLRPGHFSSPSPLLLPTLNDASHTVFAEGSIANPLLFNGDSRSLIENASGGDGNDTFIGNDADNTFRGLFGDDTFFYTGGHDTFLGGRMFTNGDTADFSLSPVGVAINPTLTFTTIELPNGQVAQIPGSEVSSSADDSAHAYSATTLTEAGAIPIADMRGIENLTGSPYADSITGNVADNVIQAGGGDDTVFYTGGFDTLDGGSGNNTVNFAQFGFAVDVTLRQAPANIAEAFTSDDTINAPGSTLRAIANLANFSNVVGTAFNDQLRGNGANNILDGGAGNDLLYYDGGVDVLNGNAGTDTADFTLSASAVSVDLTSTGVNARGNGTTSVLTGNLVGVASLQSIENINATISTT
jgi:serralysin